MTNSDPRSGAPKPPRHTVLVVEDSESLAMTFEATLEPLGYRILVAPDGKTAYEMIGANTIDCILLDLKLPDMNGIDILEDIKASPHAPAIIITTSNASLTTAVRAVRGGAFDYLVKPFNPARLVTTVENALANVALRREVETFRKTTESGGFAGFIGQSLPMQAVYRTISAAAPSTASVFITGESGTGKEVAAEALHQMSRRAGKPFVAINCAAIPHDLMESVIFGHIKGSFTGAVADQEGAAARAEGGTMFLDELGAMQPALQTKLLRFIQTGGFERVGEWRARKADIRFIAATNREPQAAIQEGRLQEDLYYRLAVVTIDLPPLRARGDDILLIARHFLRRLAEAEGKAFASLSPEVEGIFLRYAWPGNVRQLSNVIRNIMVLHDGVVVRPEMLPRLPGMAPVETVAAMETFAPQPEAVTLPATSGEIIPLALAEQRYIENAIKICSGNLQLAARRLEISPSTIYRKREGWASSTKRAEPNEATCAIV